MIAGLMNTMTNKLVIMMAGGTVLAVLAAAQPSPASNRNSMAYVLTNSPVDGSAHFGAVDISGGSFVPIGSDMPGDLGHALLPARGRSLLSLGLTGMLYSIDSRTGAASQAGVTGLGDCSTPQSPCGSNSANTIAYFDGKYYALDFSQNLYSMNPATGATTLIAPTGMPHVTLVPGSIDPSTGKLNLYFESVFSFRGKLYANFDQSQLDLSTGSASSVTPAALYEIDPKTGVAKMIAPTDPGLLTIVNVNDTLYAFDAFNMRFVTLDLATGHTQMVSNIDPSAGLVCGATPARPIPSDLR